MMKKKYILKSLLLLSFLVVGTNALRQTTKKRPDTAVSNTYECGIPIIAPQQCDRVQNKGNAIDTDDTTFAKLTANAGLLVGLGAHTSTLTLTHNSIVPNPAAPIPNYYTKISVPGNNELFGALLGGALGNLLSDVLGAVLFGNETATFQLLNGSTSVISGNIYSSSFSNNPNMQVVVTGNGDYYILMHPTAAFDRLRVNLQLGAIAGLLNETELDVYDAFYYDNVTRCDIPIMTSYSATGGLLGLSVLPTNPVQGAHLAIDNDIENTYSTIGVTSLLGLSTASTVEQFFHLPTEVDDKSVRITMRMPTSLLKLTIADQSSVVFYHDGVEIGATNIDENILGLDLLGLINADDTKFSFAVAPRDASGAIIPFDKVGIRVNIPVGLDLLGGDDIQVYDFAVINDTPVIAKVCTQEFLDANNIREIKFDITQIIPNYNSANTYVVRDINGNNIDLSIAGNEWQPLGSYIVRGITGSAEYCPNEDVNIVAVQDTTDKITGSIAISMPLDADDDGIADAEHTFNPADYTVPAGYGSISIYNENTLADVTGQTIAYPQIGSYNYYAKAISNDGACHLIKRVTVYVYDKAECEYRYEQLMADQESASTVTLLGIPLGGTSESARAVDTDLSTHGSIFNVVSLLGIGTTSQKLLFTGTNANGYKDIPEGTPLTIKLGQEYSLLQVIGAVIIRPLDTSGNAVGPFLSIGESDLLSLLVGDNVFEFTFIPKDANGDDMVYSGVQVNLGSVLGLGNTSKVFGAYIDERIALEDATCNPNITINGAETPAGLDETLLLNTSAKDVLWGVQDAGLGVATALSGVLYPYLAADAIDDVADPLYGTSNYETAAIFNTSVAALNRQTLTVKFKEIARPGDRVRIVMSSEGLPVLDLNLLQGFTMQRYMGNTPIGDEVAASGFELIKLDLLELIANQSADQYAVILEGIGAPFDRVEIRMDNVVSANVLGDRTYIHDVALIPYFAFDSDEETTLLCTSAPFEIQKLDPCTTYELSFAYATLDSNDNITAWNDIVGSEIMEISVQDPRFDEDILKYQLQMKDLFKQYNESGNLYLKVVTKRQGCIYGDAQYLKVKVANCTTVVNPMIRTRLKSN